MKKPRISKKMIDELASEIAHLEHPRGRSYEGQAKKLLCAGYRKVLKPVEFVD